MKTNVGSLDRIIRVIVGLALIGAALSETIGAWGWIGLIPLVTGLSGYCPAYLLFGFNTCEVASKKT